MHKEERGFDTLTRPLPLQAERCGLEVETVQTHLPAQQAGGSTKRLQVRGPELARCPPGARHQTPERHSREYHII